MESGHSYTNTVLEINNMSLSHVLSRLASRQRSYWSYFLFFLWCFFTCVAIRAASCRNLPHKHIACLQPPFASPLLCWTFHVLQRRSKQRWPKQPGTCVRTVYDVTEGLFRVSRTRENSHWLSRWPLLFEFHTWKLTGLFFEMCNSSGGWRNLFWLSRLANIQCDTPAHDASH